MRALLVRLMSMGRLFFRGELLMQLRTVQTLVMPLPIRQEARLIIAMGLWFLMGLTIEPPM